MSTMQLALDYASRGWRVHPIHWIKENGKCSCGREHKETDKSPGKHPILTGWQTQASTNEDKIIEWLEENPKANIGVAFGPASGIIDIECDDDEIEKRLFALFGGEIPVCPTFVSARGKHRIFKWTADLPCKDKNVFTIDKIEFRTGSENGGAQSVFPPSIHKSGKVYTWVIPPDEVDPPEIPSHALDRIYEALQFERPKNNSTRKASEWQRIAEGVGEGERNQSAAAIAGKILRDIDITNNDTVRMMKAMLFRWNASNNPPMDEDELDRTWESIVARENQRRTNEDFDHAFNKYVDKDDPGRPDDPSKPLGDWRLVIIDSDPKAYRLYSPLWSTKGKGYVTMSAAVYREPAAIAVAALEQTDMWVDTGFKRLWLGTPQNKGLAARLLDSAEHQDASIEEHRERYVAQQLLNQLSEASNVDPEKGYTGRIQREENGSVVFQFSTIMERCQHGPEPVKRREMSQAIAAAGGVRVQERHGKNGARISLYRVPLDGITRLTELVYGNV